MMRLTGDPLSCLEDGLNRRNGLSRASLELPAEDVDELVELAERRGCALPCAA